MKSIQQVSVYQPGILPLNPPTKQAVSLSVTVTNDNLINSCQVYFEMYDSNGQTVYYGNTSIVGDDYTSWDGNNDYPYQYIAKLFSLTILE